MIPHLQKIITIAYFPVDTQSGSEAEKHIVGMSQPFVRSEPVFVYHFHIAEGGEGKRGVGSRKKTGTKAVAVDVVLRKYGHVYIIYLQSEIDAGIIYGYTFLDIQYFGL